MAVKKYTTLIDATDLHDILGNADVRVFDLRFKLGDTHWGLSAYGESHIPGSRYLHLNDDLSGTIRPGKTGRHPLPDPRTFAALLRREGLRADDQVVVYDQSHGGIASRLWWMLRWVGHASVAVLNGGWRAWSAGGYNVEANTPPVEISDYVPNFKASMATDADEVEQIRLNPKRVLVDSRASARYRGEVEPIDPVAGHIPGALNIPFASHVDDLGLWCSQEEIRSTFATVAQSEESPVFYCGSGVTACHNILAYTHAGLGEAVLYPGSWSEWITDPDRAVR